MQTLQGRKVYQVNADLCLFGLLTHGIEAKKPTTCLTNSWDIADVLNVKCDKSHHHQPRTGGRADHATIYPNQRCISICRGLKKQLYKKEANMAPPR